MAHRLHFALAFTAAAAAAVAAAAPAAAGPWTPEPGRQYLRAAAERFEPSGGEAATLADSYAWIYLEHGLAPGVALLADIPVRQRGEGRLRGRLGARAGVRSGLWAFGAEVLSDPRFGAGEDETDLTLFEASLLAGRSLGRSGYAAAQLGYARDFGGPSGLVWRVETGRNVFGPVYAAAKLDGGRSLQRSRAPGPGAMKAEALLGARLARGTALELVRRESFAGEGGAWQLGVVLRR